MSNFAAGKKAIGVCDRCAQTYLLKELKFQTIRMKKSNLRVCPKCLDEDHPQYRLGTFVIRDPQALKNPRPEDNSDRTLIPPAPLLTGNT